MSNFASKFAGRSKFAWANLERPRNPNLQASLGANLEDCWVANLDENLCPNLEATLEADLGKMM